MWNVIIGEVSRWQGDEGSWVVGEDTHCWCWLDGRALPLSSAGRPRSHKTPSQHPRVQLQSSLRELERSTGAALGLSQLHHRQVSTRRPHQLHHQTPTKTKEPTWDLIATFKLKTASWDPNPLWHTNVPSLESNQQVLYTSCPKFHGSIWLCQ